MREHDIIELILLTAKLQLNTADVREDEVLNVLNSIEESFTITDDTPVITRGDAIVIWGTAVAPTVKWDLATWGDFP